MSCKEALRAASVAALFIIGLGLGSCSDPNPFQRIGDFDQMPLLVNYQDNLIIPGYLDLSSQADSLLVTIDLLSENPNIENLGLARNQLLVTRLSWQRCAMYQFGPAESLALTSFLNIYPIDKNQIASNISSGTYDLSLTSNLDAKGFQTLEYFLFGSDLSDEEVLFSLDEPTLQYMHDVASDIASACELAYTGWIPTGGDYQGTFSNEDALGVSPSSSVAKMVNGFIRDFERFTRDGKIGIPLGIRSLGEPILSAQEAPFAGYSVELLRENLEAYQEMFNGGSGIGFDDYLKEVGAVTNGNEDLAQRIENQFTAIQVAVAKIQDPLDDAILNQKADVDQVFAEMQMLVVLLKSDFTSSIGVSISYQDTDGD